MNRTDRRSHKPRRALVVVGVIVLAAVVVMGLVDVLRWIGPHLVVCETSPARRLQEAARRPLLGFGLAAAVVGAASIVGVVSSRLSDQARLGVLGVGVLTSGILLGIGQSRYSSARHPTALLQIELEQLRVPPSWQFQAWVNQPGSTVTPATWGIWTSPGVTAQSACGAAETVVRSGSRTTSVTVDRTPLLGVVCTIAGQRSDGKVFARVSGSLNDLADYAFIGQTSSFPRGGAGPAIAIQLTAKT